MPPRGGEGSERRSRQPSLARSAEVRAFSCLKPGADRRPGFCLSDPPVCNRPNAPEAYTAAGLLFGKLLSALSHGTINPLIGAAGISAFPMAGRLAARVAHEEDFGSFILMHAMGANTAAQLGSVMADGILLALVTRHV